MRPRSKEALDFLRKTYGDALLPFVVKESAAVQNTVNEGAAVTGLRAADEVRQAIGELASRVSPLVPATKTETPASTETIHA